jgi:hypothetical protein
MATPVPDPMVWPVVEAMVASLEDQSRCLVDPPRVVMARPGDRIELLLAEGRDECCEGLGWVRVVTIYPSANFPTPDSDGTQATMCGPIGWAIILEIGIARCAPVPAANVIPSAAEWNTVVEAVMADAAAIRRAVAVFKTLEDYEDTPWLVGAWLPLPTEGGCVGGAMQVTISAVPCDQTGVCT